MGPALLRPRAATRRSQVCKLYRAWAEATSSFRYLGLRSLFEPLAPSTAADHRLTKLRYLGRPLACARKCVTLVSRAVHVGPQKAASNLKKHGVSFVEAASVFADPLAAMVEDALDPERAILIGQSEKGRVLLVVFIEQSEDTIHIISARRATSHERKRYEEGGW